VDRPGRQLGGAAKWGVSSKDSGDNSQMTVITAQTGGSTRHLMTFFWGGEGEGTKLQSAPGADNPRYTAEGYICIVH